MKKEKKEYKETAAPTGKKNIQRQSVIKEEKNAFSEYPLYPLTDNFYNESKEEPGIDAEQISKIGEPDEKAGNEIKVSSFYGMERDNDLYEHQAD